MDERETGIRRKAIEQCAGILLGERGRLLKLQQKLGIDVIRNAQITKLHAMAARLRKLK